MADRIDAFRFNRVALGIQTKTAAQKLVLLTLAIRANGKTGTCHPSYESLCRDTGLSRATIARALCYLRDELKVLNWKQGHSNQYTKPLANLYTLDYAAMKKLSSESAESQSESAESHSRVAESHSGVAESHAESQMGVAESQALRHQLPYATTMGTTTKNPTTHQPTGVAAAFSGKKQSDGRTPEVSDASAALSLSSELSTLSLSSELSTPVPTLGDLHRKLTPENQKLWYRRTQGDNGAEGLRVALEILAKQEARQ